jgi:hypothetical protein
MINLRSENLFKSKLYNTLNPFEVAVAEKKKNSNDLHVDNHDIDISSTLVVFAVI